LLRSFLLSFVAVAAVPLGAQLPGGMNVRSINEIRSLALESGRTGIEVKLRATVTQPPGRLPGSARFFYVQDATGGIAVVPPQRIDLPLWEIVEVAGQLQLYNELEPEVKAARITRLGRADPVQPIALSLDDARNGRFAGRLVTVSGVVLHKSISEDWGLIIIGAPAQRVRLQLRNPGSVVERLEQIAAKGATVRGQGILVPVADGHFQVRMGTIEDLTQIEAPPLKIPRAALWAGGIVLLAAALAALWIITLRRSIRAKTAEIEDLLQKAQEANRLKSEFLANVSHEIRTPMHGILALQELVLDARLDPEARQQLEVAHSTTLSLLTLLNDLLDFSRIEANRLAINLEELDPRMVLREAVTSLKVTADDKNIRLRWSASPDTPERVVCDRSRLRQILLNLLSNAVKFTNQGEVEAVMGLERAEGNHVILKFSVRDTGPGIPPEQIEAIFQPFRQADGSVTRRYGGSGLGLSIAARLVSLLGGRIWVVSEVGKGSVFHFTIRCESPETSPQLLPPRPESAGAASSLPALRILVAEDNRVNQLVARRLLEKAGHNVTVCENGREATEKALAGHFDAILMDIQMPGLDGLEATRLIRQAESGNGRRTPIIALTAHGLEQDFERCMAAGMDDYVSKPFRSGELYRALARALGSAGSPGLSDRLQ
jgi:signal transduction histidine kinase/ActR/RegA family two-component response regulator